MKTVKIQTAFFFKEDYNKAFESFSIIVQDVFGQSDRTIYNPIDNSAPSDIPRVEVRYKDFVISIAKNRIDILMEKLEQFNEYIERFNSINFLSLGVQIKRIGLVRTYFLEKDISTANNLLNSDFSDLKLKEVNLRINIESEVMAKKCNDIEKVNVGQLGTKDKNGNEYIVNGYLIDRDINTSADEVYEIGKGERDELLKSFLKKTEEYILKAKLD
ncbi:hypothetical protein KEM09_17885 [Carboxylicivirga mesophila]|uniref:Uncharacterized protein n=1 Tax=Carboxylicivirga mesophila TaxID=1166478 RepID=A0ABS5KE58_9BACT|nr:hypothetical protein [Carboxylicivirga mesophila]MBS2213290.1 hypothetical protein [Carboxylicivirga mesophila]